MDNMYKKIHDGSVRFAYSNAGIESYDLFWWKHDKTHWPVFPLVAEETRRNQGRPSFKMSHKWLMFSTVFDGAQAYDFDTSQPFTIERGEICVIPPNCNYICTGDRPYHKLVLMIDGTLLQDNCSVLGIDEPSKISHMQATTLLGSILKITELLKSDVSNIVETLSVTGKLLAELSIALSTHRIFADYKLFTEVKIPLGDHLDQAISLNDIAAQFNISKSFLHKLFRKYSSMTPVQYRINRKMECACYRLAYTEQSMKEIAYQLGYSNQHYFSNDFKKHFAITPSEYRKNKV